MLTLYHICFTLPLFLSLPSFFSEKRDTNLRHASSSLNIMNFLKSKDLIYNHSGYQNQEVDSGVILSPSQWDSF